MKTVAQMRAYSAVENAVRRGKWPPAKSLKCKDCGGQAAHYDHTEGYENKLTVDPVCVRCHTKREQIRGKKNRFKASHLRICFLCFKPFRRTFTGGPGDGQVFCTLHCARSYEWIQRRKR